jgi:hypothetical protein
MGLEPREASRQPTGRHAHSGMLLGSKEPSLVSICHWQNRLQTSGPELGRVDSF